MSSWSAMLKSLKNDPDHGLPDLLKSDYRSEETTDNTMAEHFAHRMTLAKLDLGSL